MEQRDEARIQDLRAQGEAAGGKEAYLESKKEASEEKHARINAHIDSLGGPEAVKARTRADFAKAVAEAETASTNSALDERRRQYLESAINKADKAIVARSAGGAKAYVELAVEELKQASSPGLSELFQGSGKDKDAGGDAWGALVNSSNKPNESRPNA